MQSTENIRVLSNDKPTHKLVLHVLHGKAFLTHKLVLHALHGKSLLTLRLVLCAACDNNDRSSVIADNDP